MKASDDEQVFLFKLSSAQSKLTSAWDVMDTAARMLGEYLGVDRTAYGEVSGPVGERIAHVRAQHIRRGARLPDTVDYEVRAGGWMDLAFLNGEPVIVVDVARDQRMDEHSRASYLATGTHALLAVSLVRDAQDIVTLGVQHGQPREWTFAELRLVSEVAERTWSAAERARAETQLRETEAVVRSHESWNAAQASAFREAVNGAPLASSLGYLVRWMCAQTHGRPKCAIYLDNGTGGLSHVIGMSDAYARQVEALQITPTRLACGLALASGQAVITPDVFADPEWKDWTWLAKEHGYRAAWSFPIELAKGKYAGSFAMYFPERREATEADLKLAARMTQSASLVISRFLESESRWRAETTLRGIQTQPQFEEMQSQAN